MFGRCEVLELADGLLHGVTDAVSHVCKQGGCEVEPSGVGVREVHAEEGLDGVDGGGCVDVKDDGGVGLGLGEGIGEVASGLGKELGVFHALCWEEGGVDGGV